MADFILSCCSTADLSKEHFERRQIHYICFHYTLDGVEYPDDLGQSVSFDRFYQAMADGAQTSTSQVNVQEYLEYFTGFLEAGKDLLHVTLSSGISGSYQSACIAAEQLREKYPERRIDIVDSLGASSGYGLFMDTLADLRDSGMGQAELAQWAEENRLKLHHWFFSTDLTFYIKGGRVSKTSGTIGMLLGICPLLNMDHLGRLIPRAKIRSKKRVIQEIVKRMEEHAQDGLDYSGKCYLCQSACLEDAQAVAAAVEARFPKLNGKCVINPIGTTIGSHTGPGPSPSSSGAIRGSIEPIAKQIAPVGCTELQPTGAIFSFLFRFFRFRPVAGLREPDHIARVRRQGFIRLQATAFAPAVKSRPHKILRAIHRGIEIDLLLPDIEHHIDSRPIGKVTAAPGSGHR